MPPAFPIMSDTVLRESKLASFVLSDIAGEPHAVDKIGISAKCIPAMYFR